MTYTIEIPYQVKSLNEFRKHKHWGWRHKLTKTYIVSVFAAMNNAKIPKAVGPVKLTVTTYRNRRILDRDNLVGGAKPMIDALTAREFIVDDTEEMIPRYPEGLTQKKCKKGEERTVITREDLC